jgi:hypothetical protein
VAVAPATPEQELAWEAERRPLAVGSAAVAAVLSVVAPLLLLLGVQRDFPTVGVVQALTPALQGRPEAVIDARATQVHYFTDHAVGLIAYAVLNLIGLLALAVALYYLFVATRARRPALPEAFKWLILIGPAVYGLASVVREIIILARSGDIPDPCTPSACGHDAIDHVFAQQLLPGSLGLLGQLALAFAIVVTALNAMRAGLLTRFMGVLGIIVGGLIVIPITGGLPVVQAFWLGALVPLYAMRWPQGQPPAWLTGVAEPWPSAQDARAEREAEANRREAELIKDAPAASEEDPVEPVKPAHPSSKKRRKRRR